MLASQTIERRLIQLALLLGDALGLIVSFLLALQVRFPRGVVGDHISALYKGGQLYVVFAAFFFSHYIFDLYEPRHWRSSLFSPLKILFASVTSIFILFAWFYFLATDTTGVYGRGVLLGSILIFTCYSLVFRHFVSSRQNAQLDTNEWLLVGSEGSYINLQKDWPKLKMGAGVVWIDYHTLADNKHILESQMQREWSGIIVDSRVTSDADASITRLFMEARMRGRLVLSLMNFYEFYFGKVPIRNLNDSWFAFTDGFSIIHSHISSRLKRLTDIFISTLMLVVLSPVMLLLVVLIKIESRGEALYKQVRVGRKGRHFVMWKFRSMRQDAEKGTGAQWAAKNDARITRMGMLMRKTRLDELPQLWNILKGEMSFIGPRPERPEFTADLRKKIQFYDFRHLVKPGLTGWAQVMYPYGASVEDAVEKLQFDLFYIKNYSFTRDIEIILKTVSVVLFGAGR